MLANAHCLGGVGSWEGDRKRFTTATVSKAAAAIRVASPAQRSQERLPLPLARLHHMASHGVGAACSRWVGAWQGLWDGQGGSLAPHGDGGSAAAALARLLGAEYFCTPRLTAYPIVQ